jgi:hypothetical protein
MSRLMSGRGNSQWRSNLYVNLERHFECQVGVPASADTFRLKGWYSNAKTESHWPLDHFSKYKQLFRKRQGIGRPQL